MALVYVQALVFLLPKVVANLFAYPTMLLLLLTQIAIHKWLIITVIERMIGSNEANNCNSNINIDDLIKKMSVANIWECIFINLRKYF